MKTVAIFLCCAFFVSYVVVRADDDADAVPPSCLEKVGVTLSDLPSMLTDRSDEGRRKRACLWACNMQIMGWMTGNTINVDVLKAQVEKVLGGDERKEQMLQLLDTCEAKAKAAGDDECNVAHEFSRCGFMEMKKTISQMFPRRPHDE